MVADPSVHLKYIILEKAAIMGSQAELFEGAAYYVVSLLYSYRL